MKDHGIDYWMLKSIGNIMEIMKFFFDRLPEMESPIEKIAYLELISLYLMYGYYNLLVLPQQQIKDYRVDFLVKHKETRVVVECDGHDFHEKTKEQASKDKKRDRELQKLGYIVLRYSGADIVRDPSKITDDLQEIFGIPKALSPQGGKEDGETT